MKTRDFKIHCIALTKNEADVIEDCLAEAAKWADRIYVYDGASTDGTWEIVKSMPQPQIVPWKQDGKVFSEGLRAEVFEAFRRDSSPGDWWLQLNVDEYYPESPRSFFARVPRWQNFVWGITVEYFITDKDLETIDFSQPFGQVRPLLRYYRASWSEPRAFRYRPGLHWSTSAAWPRHAGVVAKERMVFRHYPFRSPRQIQTRLDVRRDNRSRGFAGWDHASEESWRDKIVPASQCLHDDGVTPPAIEWDRLPKHLESLPLRAAKRLLHAAAVWA